MSRPVLASLTTAGKRAQELGDEYVSTEHLLVGLASDGGQAAEVLRKAGAGPDVLLEAFEKIRGTCPGHLRGSGRHLSGAREVRRRFHPARPARGISTR